MPKKSKFSEGRLGQTMRNLRGLMNMVKDSRREPTVDIRLSSVSPEAKARVQYDFTSLRYREIPAEDLLDCLLFLPSRVMLKEDLQRIEEEKAEALAAAMAGKASSCDGEEGHGSERVLEGGKEIDDLEGCEEVISKEELRKLDSQPNPFNFSERVTQTVRLVPKDQAVQTDPPPSTTFCVNVGLSNIYDAYAKDYEKKKARELEKEREKEREKEKERASKNKQPDKESESTPPSRGPSRAAQHGAGTLHPSPAPHHSHSGGLFSHLSEEQLARLAVTVKTIERMVNQNIYDEITQDFRYWEDMSDEFRGREGSLLPLWRFSCSTLTSLHGASPAGAVAPTSGAGGASGGGGTGGGGFGGGVSGLLVTEICWSPVYPDLFAAAYSTAESSGGEGAGAVCLYSLKNPAAPERVLLTDAGVTSVDFHPEISSLVAAGRSDGVVSVHDVTNASAPTELTSSALGGKHLLPVSQVRWVRTEPGEKLCLFSVSLDGRVTQWLLDGAALVHTDLLQFPSACAPSHPLSGQPDPTPTPSLGSSAPVTSPTSMTSALADTSSFNALKTVLLEGTGTHIAFRPDDESILLVGCDSGLVFQCSTASTVHALTRYEAHAAPIRALSWNRHNHKVFLSAGVDWTLKIWLQYHLTPLVVVDLGGSVADASWAPYSSTVVVAATDEGKVHVFDFYVRRCRPLCVQNLTQKKRVLAACVAISPFHPVILVAGDRGHLVCMKLSPNLRRPHKEAKGADEQRLKEIEVAKIDRIIATNRG